jgi:hypothetical protein
MSLEDDVNKRLSASYVPEPVPDWLQSMWKESEDSKARLEAARLAVQKEHDAIVENFKKDVPYANKIVAKANSLIQPIIQNFQNGLTGRFPIVNLEGGVSYNLGVPDIEQKGLKNWNRNPYVYFGQLEYTLVWGKIFPTIQYEKAPFFSVGRENWEKADYSRFKVSMATIYGGDHVNEFGGIYSTGFNFSIEQWLKATDTLERAIREGLEHPERFLFNEKNDYSPQSWDGSRGQ